MTDKEKDLIDEELYTYYYAGACQNNSYGNIVTKEQIEINIATGKELYKKNPNHSPIPKARVIPGENFLGAGFGNPNSNNPFGNPNPVNPFGNPSPFNPFGNGIPLILRTKEEYDLLPNNYEKRIKFQRKVRKIIFSSVVVVVALFLIFLLT